MKRTHRVSIEIEQSKLTFSLAHAAPPVTASESGTEGGNALKLASYPPACQDCGAPWITMTAQAGEAGLPGENGIYLALQQRGLHLHVSPTGQLLICSKSFEEIRCNESKESL